MDKGAKVRYHSPVPVNPSTSTRLTREWIDDQLERRDGLKARKREMRREFERKISELRSDAYKIYDDVNKEARKLARERNNGRHYTACYNCLSIGETSDVQSSHPHYRIGPKGEYFSCETQDDPRRDDVINGLN
jgi:hypothetical protein